MQSGPEIALNIKIVKSTLLKPIDFGPDCITFNIRVDIKLSFKTERKKQHHVQVRYKLKSLKLKVLITQWLRLSLVHPNKLKNINKENNFSQQKAYL